MNLLGSVGQLYMFALLTLLFLGFGLAIWSVISHFAKRSNKKEIEVKANNNENSTNNQKQSIKEINGGFDMANNGWLKLAVFSFVGILISFAVLGLLTTNSMNAGIVGMQGNMNSSNIHLSHQQSGMNNMPMAGMQGNMSNMQMPNMQMNSMPMAGMQGGMNMQMPMYGMQSGMNMPMAGMQMGSMPMNNMNMGNNDMMMMLQNMQMQMNQMQQQINMMNSMNMNGGSMSSGSMGGSSGGGMGMMGGMM